MASESPIKGNLTFKPVTVEEWDDLQALFGQSGTCTGCWCMWWRLKRSEFNRQYGDGNRDALRRITELGEVPGILAYLEREPIGWCSVAPREAFPALDRSRTLKRVDDTPVWSIACFFVAKPFRRQGMTEALIGAAVEYARERCANVIEAYPVNPDNSKHLTSEGYTGVTTTFRRLGFEEVLRRSKTRTIMRYDVSGR